MQLKEIRTSKNLSAARLGARCGMHYRTIQDIEKRGDCMVSNAIKLAAALGVTLDELCAQPKALGTAFPLPSNRPR